jgi:hypothetical protein
MTITWRVFFIPNSHAEAITSTADAHKSRFLVLVGGPQSPSARFVLYCGGVVVLDTSL